jgi:hypothetical protein
MPDDSREIATTSDAGTVIAATPGSLLAAIVGLAKDPAVDTAKLQALLEMQERMEGHEAKRQFTAAFIRLQSRLPRIKREGVLSYPVDKAKPDGPQRVISNYARWEDIDEAIRPLLDEEGFALSFKTKERAGGGTTVIAILLHQAGYSTETEVGLPVDASGGKNNLQGYGSAISYGKRYAATAALNIITENEDDDGKAGGLKLMTREQVLELERLIVDTGANRAAFLKHLAVERLEHLADDEFARVKNLLLEMQSRRRAKAEDKR